MIADDRGSQIADDRKESCFHIQSNLDYPDLLGPHETLVRIIENMNINEEQNLAVLIKLRK